MEADSSSAAVATDCTSLVAVVDASWAAFAPPTALLAAAVRAPAVPCIFVVPSCTLERDIEMISRKGTISA
jgi:hypothetical protein